MSSTYTAKDITVLEGLEPVRKRPGMYIGGVGTAGLHHLVWEVLDNAIDEAMNGHASNISVTLHTEGTSLTVTDDGRGIPVDKHPKTGKSALEVIFTVLHAGGKFEQGNYKTAGGLHGVGASVVNALSKDLVATVKRDGVQWEQRFRQGVPQGPIKKVGPARGTGTTVFFHPDPTIFPKIEFDAALIQERLEVASYIHRGLKITFLDEASGARTQYSHENGLLDYLKKLVAQRGANRRPRHRLRARARQRLPHRPRAAVDRVDRRTRQELRQRHSHRLRRHARKRPARRHRQGDPQLHRHAQPVAEGRHAERRRHPRRARRDSQRVRAGAAVPGPDEGSPEQSRDARGRRRRGASGPRALAESQQLDRRSDRRAHHSRGARA